MDSSRSAQAPLPTSPSATSAGVQPATPRPAREWAAQITQALEVQRGRARDFLETECNRIRKLELTLSDLLREISSETAIESGTSLPTAMSNETELAALRAALAETEHELELRTQQLHGMQSISEAEEIAEPRTDEVTAAELRRLRDENHDLANRLAATEHELRSARGTVGTPGMQSAAASAWEAKKKQVIERLEADAMDAELASTCITLEDLVRTTDRVIAEKDFEIRNLRQLIEDQSRRIDGMVTGAAAVATILDQDDIIRQERENIKRMEIEWREKLRRAEIDLSLERAKMAREQAVLAERALQLEQDQSKKASSDPATPCTKGRWMSRLGLNAT